ncbi:MAG: guanylate kinase [Mariprofundaceae bacterium]|nr:guanylate kinase [Mariprofundaceae bacterium]
MSRLFVVSGPSGAGKSSLCTALLKDCPKLKLSISCTTRAPRLGEKDGCEYHFLDIEDFEKQKGAGAFLEWAKVHDHFYGTRQSDVLSVLQKGDDVLLEIDWQGAAQVAEKMPDLMRIFILPPSIESLRERLMARGQDDALVIERRVAAAEAEMSHAAEAHYQVVNDDFDKALQTLRLLVAK